jgi:transposase
LISRDRAETYADGATRGAPEAIQVADRFHLLCNLTSAIERIFETKRSELFKASTPGELKVDYSIPIETPTKMTGALEGSKQRRECRLERYNKVIELHRQGMSNQAIAQILQIGRKTVGRFLRSEIFPERATPRRKAPRVNKLRAYLEKRWAKEHHNTTALYRELKTQGYLGGRSMVARLVSTFRTPETQYHRKRNQQSAPKAKRRPLSPRQAAMLIARPAEKLNDAEKQLVTRLEQCCPGIAALQLPVTGFSAVFKNHDPAALQSWIERATATGLAAIKTFCDGLLRDQTAVKAAISLKWSNGQVEGQVHRLKLIKRQMYGRASFELLRARVLPYAPTVSQISP